MFFPSRENLYLSDKIATGGDQGVGNVLNPPQPLPVNLCAKKQIIKGRGFLYCFPLFAINMALLRRAVW